MRLKASFMKPVDPEQTIPLLALEGRTLSVKHRLVGKQPLVPTHEKIHWKIIKLVCHQLIELAAPR